MSYFVNLPPGCTPRDIDRAMGELARCVGCRKEYYHDQLDEDGLCPWCRSVDQRLDQQRDDRMMDERG